MIRVTPTADRPSTSPKSPRSAGRPPVPLERIIATALELLDEEGAGALSLRSLAQRLGSGTATLYRHFESRTDLVAAVVDRIIGEVELDPALFESVNWRQACEAVATAMFEVLCRHRNAAPLLAEHIPIGENALRLRERGLAVLLAAGFGPRDAVTAYATVARHVIGFALQLGRDSTAERAEADHVSALIHRLDPTLFPATIAVADSMPVPLEEEFAFGLQLILAGLAQRREGRLTS
ncbi:TetR/AcrR family transcriptional regulator C-terminal domain-containing protein [Smaragdicoccus niigatensis]|uniref:TetR/AcrR family transcriptional regulator C-terminal domain-containing protein n=1 Tax=Smaragdicoccus niigatensis TaxID=359359 RepID=UPI00037E2D64